MKERDDRQSKTAAWCEAAFGTAHARDLAQRGVRFLEEAVGLSQAAGVNPERATGGKVRDMDYSKTSF